MAVCINCAACSFDLTPPVACLKMNRSVIPISHNGRPERGRQCLCQQVGRAHLSQARSFRLLLFLPLLACCWKHPAIKAFRAVLSAHCQILISYRKHRENLRRKNIDATVDDAADVAAGLLHIMKDGVCALVFHNTTIVHWLLSGCFSAQNGGNLKRWQVKWPMWWKASPLGPLKHGTPTSPGEETQRRHHHS